MNGTLVVLRLIHVVVGVFWAGTIIFMGLFLAPSLKASGPAGGEVMKQLNARRFSAIMPIAGLLAVLTGLDMLRRDFPGGPAAWFASPGSRTFAIGGLAAILMLIIGVTLTLPTVKKMQTLAAASPAPGTPEAAELEAVRGRLGVLSKLGVVLVGITVVCMAIARYVG